MQVEKIYTKFARKGCRVLMDSENSVPIERPCPVLPAHLLSNARILPKRDDILPLLPKGGVFVEVGVALGDYSKQILRVCEPDLFIGLDIFTIHESKMIWGKPVAEVMGGKTHGEFYRDRFKTEIETGRMQVMEGDSSKSLAKLDDASIDIAYLDADHTYDFVRNELALLNRKVNQTGWIILNDYTMGNIKFGGFKRFGVIQAAHEFMMAEGWEMIYLALHPNMYCDVALRRAI
jgi:hypothetical protein